VAFRGTLQWSNWLTNFSVFPTPLSPHYPSWTGPQHIQAFLRKAEVHGGFASAYFDGLRAGIVNEIDHALQRHRGQISEVVFTGHSLGGALATLAALDFVLLNLRSPLASTVKVYTFGSPRVGEESFASVYNLLIPNHWAVVNRNDLVSAVPSFSAHYFHVGKRIWYRDHYSYWTSKAYVMGCCVAENSHCKSRHIDGYNPRHWNPLRIYFSHTSYSDPFASYYGEGVTERARVFLDRKWGGQVP